MIARFTSEERRHKARTLFELWKSRKFEKEVARRVAEFERELDALLREEPDPFSSGGELVDW